MDYKMLFSSTRDFVQYSIYIWFIFWVAFVLLVLVSFYFSTPEGNAWILRTIARLAGGKAIKEFDCQRFNLFPFYLDKFTCTLAASKASPEAKMSFHRLQVNIEYLILLNPYFYFSPTSFLANHLFSRKATCEDAGNEFALVRVVIEGLQAASPSIQFRDFLGTASIKAKESLYLKRLDPKQYVPVPSSSPMVLAVKKMIATAMKFVEIRIKSFQFDFLLPHNSCEIHGKCSQMILSIKESKTLGILGMKVFNTILEGEVSITQAGTKAVEYRGQKAKFCIDYYLLNGMMDVMVIMSGQQDYAWINLYPFVQFYINYQKAEDDLLEAKIACGRPTTSKMNMCAEIEFMKVELVDHRMPLNPPLTVLLRKLHAEMLSFPLTLDGKKTLKAKLCSEEVLYDPVEGSFLPKPLPPSNPLMPYLDNNKMSPNVLKIMSAVIEKVSFHLEDFWNGNNEIEGIVASQTRRVNNDSTFIDNDLMEAKIDSILFKRLSTAMLDWLVVLQDTSNRMPTSRFAHQKTATIKASLPSFIFGTSPLHFNYDVLLFKAMMQNFSLPLSSLPLDENRQVTFYFHDFQVEMSRGHETRDSECRMQAKVLEIKTSLPTSDLEEQYHISLMSSGNQSDIVEGEERDSGDEDSPSQATIPKRLAEKKPSGLMRQKAMSFTVLNRKEGEDGDDEESSGHTLPKHIGPRRPSNLSRQRRISFTENPAMTLDSKGSEISALTNEETENEPESRSERFSLQRKAGYSPHESQDLERKPVGRVFFGSNQNLGEAREVPSPPLDNRRALFATRMHSIEQRQHQSLPGNYSSMKEPEDEEMDTTTLLAPGADYSESQRHRHNQRRPITGSIWRFDNFDCSFLLGVTSMFFHFFKTKQFTVNLINGFPSPTLLLGSSSGSGKSIFEQEEEVDEDGSYTIYRDIFLSMHNINATWLSISDIHCAIGPSHTNASAAGAIKFLCAFNMIRKTADRITARMDAIKNRFVPPEILNLHPELRSSLPPAVSTANTSNSGGSKTILKFSDLTMIVAAQAAPTSDTLSRAGSNTSLSAPPTDGLSASYRFPSNYSDSRGSLGAMRVFSEERSINKCLIVKLKNVFAEMAPDSTVGKFSNCEMIVNNFAIKPFLEVDDFSYEKSSIREKADLYDIATQKQVTKDHIVSVSQKISANEITFNFHHLMELGEVIDELLTQQAAYNVAMTPTTPPKPSLGGDTEDFPSRVSSDNSDTESEDGLDFLTVASTKSTSVVSDSLTTMKESDSFTPTAFFSPSGSDPTPASGKARLSTLRTSLPPTISTMDIVFKKFRMKFDGPLDNCFEEDLFILSLDKFSIHLFQDKSEDAIQDEIALLDVPVDHNTMNPHHHHTINPDSFVVYQSIFGGQLEMKIDSMVCTLSVQKEPLLEAYNLKWSGLCYNASVKDDRIPVQYKLVDVLDTMVLHPFQQHLEELDEEIDRNIQASHSNSQRSSSQQFTMIPALVSPVDSMYVVVPKSLAPGKVYMDLTWAGETMDVHLHSCATAALDVVNKVFELSTPPNLDPSPLLSPWDSLRYWLHGAFAFKFQKIVVTKHATDYLHQRVQIILSMINPEWHLDSKSFEFTANYVETIAEMTSTILPGRGRNNRKPKTTHLSMKICEIPSVIFAMRHSLRITFKDPRRSRFYNHHDVYLHPALETESSENNPFPAPIITSTSAATGNKSRDWNSLAGTFGGGTSLQTLREEPLIKFLLNNEFVDEIKYQANDRFYYFRSNKFSVNYDLELRLADRKNEPITLNLRLDSLIRVMDAMNNPHDLAQHRSNSQSPAMLPEDMRLLMLPPPRVSRPPNTLTLGSMINEMKVQMVINRVIFCSWPSAKNFLGIASLQEHTELELRMIRKNLERIFPTNILNNATTNTALSEPDGIKYFDFYATNKRLVVLKTDLISGIEEKNFPSQIDHLFMEIFYGEIYVREWSTKSLAFNQLMTTKRWSATGRTLHRSSFGGIASGGSPDPVRDSVANRERRTDSTQSLPEDAANYEPKNVDDVLELFKPIHRLAHASRVIISLTESGEVSSRSNLFSRTGILNKRDESGHEAKPTKCDLRSMRKIPGSRTAGRFQTVSDFMIGKEFRRKTVEQAYGCQLGDSNDPLQRQREAFCGMRRSTLERQHSSMGADIISPSEVGGKGKVTPKGRNRKSMLLSPGVYTAVIDQSEPSSGKIAGRPRAESAEDVVSQMKDSLVKRRRESMIKADTPSTVASQRRKSSVTLNSQSKKRLKWGSVTMGFRANFRNFLDNHAAFTPPSHALPESYKGYQIRHQSSQRFFRKGPYTDKFGYLNGVTNVAGEEGSDDSSFGNKIWGLKVVDCRILFTIAIRDVLFSYVARCMDLFSAEDSNEISPTNKDKDEEGEEKKDPIPQRRPSTINLSKGTKDKATLMDFLKVDEEKMQPAAHREKPSANKIPRAKSNSEDHTSPAHSDMREDDDSEVADISSVSKHFNVQRLESSDTMSLVPGGTAGGGGGRELQYQEIYPEATEHETWVDEAAKHRIKSRVFHTGGRGLKRNSNTRQSFNKKDFSFSVDEDDENAVPRTQKSMQRLSIDTNALPPPINTDFSQGSTPFSQASDTPMTSNGTPYLPGMTPSTRASFTSRATPNKKKVPINQQFFLVDLVDPQINFLDAHKHGSLIIVAGRSTLEGKRLNTAILPPNSAGVGGSNGEAAADPKRRQEIRLRMDGVSAFTIPTLINYHNADYDFDEDELEEEFVDEVFWKQLQSTSDSRTRPVHGQTPNFHSKTGNRSSLLPPALHLPNSPHLSSNDGEESSAPDISDSPYLKMAIQDFQIRALYVFWTDVSAAEAKELYIQQSKDPLTYSFRLELPELAVDIFSWQFYIILNVVRNVLLVPPPATSRAKGGNSREDESEEKVVELARDPNLLEGFNVNTILDIFKQKNCEEIRILVEEYLSTVVENSAIARLVEVFIGRIYWKLRTNAPEAPAAVTSISSPRKKGHDSQRSPPNSSDKELIEAALTGIYATLNFFEDRRTASLFEISRFWARNLNPSAEANSFGDKTTILLPILETKDICTRCLVEFNAEENTSKSCSFHGDDDGAPGEFKEKFTIHELTGKPQRYKAWTCCGRTFENALPCKTGPHICKEAMISIRTEAHAPIRIENVDVTIIKQLEISIFPCANYFLRLQITKNLADVLHKYFSINNAKAYESAYHHHHSFSQTGNHSGTSDSNSDTSGSVSGGSNSQSMSHSVNEGGNSEKKSKKLIPKVLKFKKKKSKSKGSSESGSLDSDQHRSGRAFSSGLGGGNAGGDEGKSLSKRSRRSLTAGGAVDISRGGQHSQVKRQEALYIVYLRVGDINVDISTSGFGFALNLDRFQVVMEKFFFKKEVSNWKGVIWQLEKHLVTSVIKNTASSSITKLFSFGRRQSNAANPLGTSSFLTNSRASMILDASYPTHPSSSSSLSSSTSSHAPVVIDPEQLLDAKKSMLFGGRSGGTPSGKQRQRNSTIGLMSKRPTLYSSPTAASFHSQSRPSNFLFVSSDSGDHHDEEVEKGEEERSKTQRPSLASRLFAGLSSPAVNPSQTQQRRASAPVIFPSTFLPSFLSSSDPHSSTDNPSLFNQGDNDGSGNNFSATLRTPPEAHTGISSHPPSSATNSSSGTERQSTNPINPNPSSAKSKLFGIF